jgi:sulfite exporter TauE/SafE
MEPASILTLVIVGFGLGLKHAIEADHLAAVSTIVTQRRSIWSASLVGGIWGIGHTISLLAAGSLVILFQYEISESAQQTFEFCVAVMLIVLGIDALRRVLTGGQIHIHSHKHGERIHFHPHVHEALTAHHTPVTPDHSHGQTAIGFRPLIIGMVHGLAGSGALMLLVLSTISSPAAGLLYILVFGAGSIGGMMLMSLLLGLPVHFTAHRFNLVSKTLRFSAGAFSLVLGTSMAYEIGSAMWK